MTYTREDWLKELVELYHVENRQDGDVDCAQMAVEWDVDTRTARIRLGTLVKQKLAERFKVHDPKYPRPIFVWRKPIPANDKSAIIDKTQPTKRRRA